MPSERASHAVLPEFAARHIGPSAVEIDAMLRELGLSSLEELVDRTVPEAIRDRAPLALPAARSEAATIARLRELADRNQVLTSLIGLGYSATFTPPVIQRNVLESPAWYTAYTPYQPEISQGRLEALLNFQTMVTDLTAMEIANASLLDEATAAAQAMAMCRASVAGVADPGHPTRNTFLVSEMCHPQTIAVVQTRAKSLGIQVMVGDHAGFQFSDKIFGVLVQYPTTDGAIIDYEPLIKSAHEAGALVIVAADILALTLV